MADKIDPIGRDYDTEAAVDEIIDKLNEIIEAVNDMWRNDE
jgi:hypothetical protein